MRLLFQIDSKNYNLNGTKYIRPSVRSIIIKRGKVAMVHSIKYDYYKFPGGGIEKDESKLEALIRETLEESGLKIIPSSIKEYGYVYRIQKGKREDVFIQENFYYLCDVEDEIHNQKLESYEEDEEFTLEYIDPIFAIKTNRSKISGPKDQNMLEREARVLEMLIEEGYFTKV